MLIHMHLYECVNPHHSPRRLVILPPIVEIRKLELKGEVASQNHTHSSVTQQGFEPKQTDFRAYDPLLCKSENITTLSTFCYFCFFFGHMT